jgi:tellurite resistance protein TehA-like permease
MHGAFRRSISKPDEAMFVSCFWLSCYGIIPGAIDYANPAICSRLSVTLLVFFWIYMACALAFTVAMHLLLFYENHLDLHNMTPAWLLP